MGVCIVPPCNSTKFIQIIISGQVQGVGFRPFVYQLAKELGACGFVRNRGGQVEVLLQAELKTLFLAQLDTHKPPQAQINTIECHDTPPIHTQDFKIAPSLTPSLSLKDTLPLDLATCELCLQDLANPKSRFFNYPFVACAHCGPRFSLLHTLPYDRAHTSMRDWVMCPACQKDYHNPQSRRFFAQSLSCLHCPITLSFYDQEGKHTDQPLERAIQAIQQGQVIALKGIGGFALICHAQNKQAVQKVRALKCRPKKPLALMVKNTAVAHTLVHLNPLELEALKAPSAPIVLAYKKSPCYDHVAPNLNTLGIILPYSALHHLLLQPFEALIFTSANLKGEPIITELETLRAKFNLEGILDHNRPIVHGIEDSILRCVGEQMGVMRLARGLSPLYIPLKSPTPLVGMGAHNKASLCWSQESSLVIPEMGTLESVAGVQNYHQNWDFYRQLYGVPQNIGIDKHPRYTSSQIGQEKALECKITCTPIQHHRAHMHALLGEWELEHPPLEGMEVLGLVCDGSGLGDHQELWGGEVFKAHFKGFWQVKHLLSLQRFWIPQAPNLIQDACTIGYCLAHQHSLSGLLTRLEKPLGARVHALKRMLDQKIQVSPTTSIGRLFDAIAGFCGVGEFNTYEGQSAAQLESLASTMESLDFYPFSLQDRPIIGTPMLEAIQQEILNNQAPLVARKFHNTLAHIALSLAQQHNLPMLFGGGVFANRLLCEHIRALFAHRVFFMPKLLSCNDGALAFGQVHFLANQQRSQHGF